MHYDFDTQIDRRHTGSLKWDKYADSDILPMWVADMDFKAAPEILDALKKRIDHGVFGYSNTPEGLNEIICARMKSRYGWHIQSDWILWVPGVVSALNITCDTFGRKNAPIVTTIPIYPPFLSAPTNTGHELRTVPMIKKNNRAGLDFDAIEKQFAGGASLFLLCSPHNPCGTVFDRDELETLIKLCRQYHVVLCSDEIHCDFILSQDVCHIPSASLSPEAQHQTVTLMAPSKTYNIPGLGCSFAIIPDPEKKKAFMNRMTGRIPHVNIMGLTAAKAAYEQCNPWLNQLIDYLRGNQARVMQAAGKMKGCSIDPFDATYLAWIDTRQTGINDPAVFFEKAGVGLSDGSDFGQKGFLRLNFGCPRSRLETGLDRMIQALEQI